MSLPLELGAVHDQGTRQALQTISNRWPSTGPVLVTSARRPPANRVAIGTMVYDTTLHKPLWSDGTTWRDATGTAA